MASARWYVQPTAVTHSIARHTLITLLPIQMTRMMFSDADVDRLRSSLVTAREALRMSPLAFTWAISENKVEPASSIGYVALAAVLNRPDPTKPTASPKKDNSQQLPSLPVSPTTTVVPHRYPRHDTPSHLTAADNEYSHRPSLNQATSDTTTGSSNARSNRHSSLALSSDSMSDVTAASMSQIEAALHTQEIDEDMPTHAVRIKIDPSAAPRWDPKRKTGAPISAGSKTALLVAVQQRNQGMVEQLLDMGVPADNGPECNLLTVAIMNHDIDTVRLLLLFGANANSKDKNGYTPLNAATEASVIEAAHLLLKYGADPNYRSSEVNPFAFALSHNKAAFVQLYLQYGADGDTLMGNGESPFVQAMTKSVSASIVQLMLLYEANPNCKNGHGETALFKAINADRIDLVTILLAHGANPNLPGPKHMLWPAVHRPRILSLLLQTGADLKRAPGVLELATSINSHDAVDILLRNGADPNAKKDGIFTPLCTAIRDNRVDLIDVLLAAGADPNLPASEYPAFKCITHHRAHLLPRLFTAGANLKSPPGIIETAIAHNERDGLIHLLDRDVDPNARSSDGHTALTTAIRLGHIDLIDILLTYGADPGVRGQEWPVGLAVKNPAVLARLLPHITTKKIIKGALEMAVVADQLESVKLLLAKGVDVEEKNGGVFSPLTTSIREDRKEIFFYLVDEAGADPNLPGEHLPIIKAIRRHREHDLSYIQHLLVKGADINLMYRGWNAVLQAVDGGDIEILSLFAKHNPDLNAVDENGRSVKEIMEERGLKEEESILLGGGSPSQKMKAAMGQLRGMVKQ